MEGKAALNPKIEEFFLIFWLQFYHFQLDLGIAFQKQKIFVLFSVISEVEYYMYSVILKGPI